MASSSTSSSLNSSKTLFKDCFLKSRFFISLKSLIDSILPMTALFTCSLTSEIPAISTLRYLKMVEASSTSSIICLTVPISFETISGFMSRFVLSLTAYSFSCDSILSNSSVLNVLSFILKPLFLLIYKFAEFFSCHRVDDLTLFNESFLKCRNTIFHKVQMILMVCVSIHRQLNILMSYSSVLTVLSFILLPLFLFIYKFAEFFSCHRVDDLTLFNESFLKCRNTIFHKVQMIRMVCVSIHRQFNILMTHCISIDIQSHRIGIHFKYRVSLTGEFHQMLHVDRITFTSADQSPCRMCDMSHIWI